MSGKCLRNVERRLLVPVSFYFLGGNAVSTLLSQDEPKQHDTRSRLTSGAGVCPRYASDAETRCRRQPTIPCHFREARKPVASSDAGRLRRNLCW